MEIDLIYGVARPPAGSGVRSWETSRHPSSMLTYAASSALSKSGDLMSFMRTAQEGCLVTGYLLDSVKLLWIIDENADLRLAVEEACHPAKGDEPTIPILIRNPAGSRDWQKLGHPSLLTPPHLGRIGGELILRSSAGVTGYWELNNSSGRYGLNCGRTPSQLDACAALFREAGLRIDTDFQGV